ncbi:MAG: hypothetical protein UY48_C0002G0033 [Candidatus Gottesmanbacteria bacterium GW2011_GWB1_49_7]|uniref:Uncharacterized protein n=1 Tax=Candidatus Gottesmanbacteria bacterium GW2011_GWB1_49_7 TaxID=1618448 RepID=A0A0G1YEE8_9BACT|nr:MAG: hypothetical protein UY48_C0002G0033 [Candidatus Gottesmanbacteria bacterium GW2011_GWB1_49_7]
MPIGLPRSFTLWLDNGFPARPVRVLGGGFTLRLPRKWEDPERKRHWIYWEELPFVVDFGH